MQKCSQITQQKKTALVLRNRGPNTTTRTSLVPRQSSGGICWHRVTFFFHHRDTCVVQNNLAFSCTDACSNKADLLLTLGLTWKSLSAHPFAQKILYISSYKTCFATWQKHGTTKIAGLYNKAWWKLVQSQNNPFKCNTSTSKWWLQIIAGKCGELGFSTNTTWNQHIPRQNSPQCINCIHIIYNKHPPPTQTINFLNWSIAYCERYVRSKIVFSGKAPLKKRNSQRSHHNVNTSL